MSCSKKVDKNLLCKTLNALKVVGFENLIILSNVGSHTYTVCRIKSVGGTVEIETESGKLHISTEGIKNIRLSYKNAVCIFESSKRNNREYRAENWFLMNIDQYKEFCRKINL